MKNTFLNGGFQGFSDVQKLEFLLFFAIPQKDTNPLAHALLDEFGSIGKVFAADYYDLLKIPGVGKHTALLIKTCKEFMYFSDSFSAGENRLSNTFMAKEYCYHKLRGLDVENFMVICLDDTNKIINDTQFTNGSNNKVHVDIREITKFAFKHGASKILIAHNHPSGNLNFSDEDLHLTHSIICSCLLNDIEVLDHVLVCPHGSISMAEAGVIPTIIKTVASKLNVPMRPVHLSATPKQEYQISANNKISN